MHNAKATSQRDISPLIHLHPNDSVAIARVSISAGTDLENGLIAKDRIPAGHKIALDAMQKGDQVLRYGEVIGIATKDIGQGGHVHSHNLAIDSLEREYAYAMSEIPLTEPHCNREFMGYVRPNGDVGTRNYIGILTTVNCSARVARGIARTFEKNPFSDHDPLAEYPNVDGVVALTHKTGCGMSSKEPLQILRRVIEGYATHPNISHVIVIGLGCEVNQINGVLNEHDGVRRMTIQKSGGTRKSVESGVEFVKSVLVEANSIKRTPVPASALKLALICGGSDGYSGISANPALGAASDLVVQQGGTVILSETPETWGAEHLLTRRATTQDVGEKLVERIQWWRDYTDLHGVSLDANPSPGNKAGGLTTILEKSLGALAKGGSTRLTEVIEYAEKPTCAGLIFMDAPGYDPVQVTGQIAGGANLVVFTTGRGSVFGSKPAPTVKLATNTMMYHHMIEDMDINCGTILDGTETIEQCGAGIFETLLAVAGGQRSKSEELDFGEDEFAPWTIGPVI
ncbi:altronate dehydratase family protein [Celeribacter halophilus]|uniref:UxaA family hydrolase n=1 Tax=Celeribacter halophilus TaxID=576117 RepID=UPI002FD4D0BE